MDSEQYPEFRLGNVLMTSFTATLSERYGDAIERVPTPQRLVDWFRVHDLQVASCSETELEVSRDLRESIHLVATAVAANDALPLEELLLINQCSESGSASPELTSAGTMRWRLHTESVSDALAVICMNTVSVLSGERGGRLALCASQTCQAAFFDTSRNRTRRWCDMNTCGNREKKARFLANKRAQRN